MAGSNRSGRGWDDVSSVDGDQVGDDSWAARLATACAPCFSCVSSTISDSFRGILSPNRQRLPHHLADPLILGGAPVAAVPEHVMSRAADNSGRGPNAQRSKGVQGGVELKPANPNPLLGQWHHSTDRSHPDVRPAC
mmetsp:Transcript_18670/g.33317  ORF Transcript_18670/g.33317 Transcript_18670/m.33317 type:complete len:137 (-) Transcript_18670:283-693(-)